MRLVQRVGSADLTAGHFNGLAFQLRCSQRSLFWNTQKKEIIRKKNKVKRLPRGGDVGLGWQVDRYGGR